ncbi:hypothetical protein [Blattabacterium cuenoti]|uniref:hypothetical protein n=1 Tax=Blattabacterium cuenoti TaxID=1653831 RepID=UPI00163C3172|nr:hypothetical protein [Blattabacterium cuenoti]
MKNRYDHLFLLIQTLSQSEKKNFNLYINRIEKNKNAKFIQLFEILIKMHFYDEKKILDNTNIKKNQLSNIKGYLYKQILMSIKKQHTKTNYDIQIREYLDFSKILYNKGLYIQSLKLLGKAKIIARNYQYSTILLELIEFEKMIESLHITRSLCTRSYELSVESKELVERIQYSNALSNLSLELYGLYLKVGCVRNEKDRIFIETYFRTNLPKFNIEKLHFYEKLFLYQSQMWYHYIRQDFLMCYRSSKKWVKLFKNHPDAKKISPISYIKGYHYLLDTLFYLNHYYKFTSVLYQFETEVKNGGILINENTEILIFMYKYTNRINKHYMEGTFSEGVKKIIPSLMFNLKKMYKRMDAHYIMVLYYKISCLYFGSGDYKNTIQYLSNIIESKKEHLRQDLQCFSRLLYLIACYESGLDENLDQKIHSTYKFFIKMNDWYQVQKEIIFFFKNLGNVYPHQIKNQFKKLKEKLIKYYEHPYEKRTFLYLDIISWLSSKIENKPVEIIIREKFLKKNKINNYHFK